MKRAGTTTLGWAFFAMAAAVLMGMVPAPALAQNPMDVLADGVIAFEDKEYAEAESHLQKAVSLDPTNPEPKYYLALTYDKTGKTAEAIQILEKLIQEHPKLYRKAYFDLSAIYSRENEYGKALAVLKDAINQEPQDARGYLEAGVVEQNMKQYDAALADFKKAADLSPDIRPTAYNLIGVVYSEQGHFDQAETQFNQVIEQYPGTPAAENARQSLVNVAVAKRARRPFKAFAEFGVGYNDNIVGVPLDPLPEQEHIDSGDWGELLLLNAEYKFINKSDIQLAVGYEFGTRGFNDYTENDILHHNPFARLEYNYKPCYFKLEYDFAYYYVGSVGADKSSHDWGWFINFDTDNDKLKQNTVLLTAIIDEPNNLSTEIALMYTGKDYFSGSIDSTNAYCFELTQRWAIGDSGRVLWGGYAYAKEEEKAGPLSYHWNAFRLGLFTPLYWGIDFGLNYRLFFREFGDYPSWIGDRKDTTQVLDAKLLRNINDWFRIEFLYTYSYNDSNLRDIEYGTSTYDYRQNLYMLNLHFEY